jgi:hypothetical protein
MSYFRTCFALCALLAQIPATALAWNPNGNPVCTVAGDQQFISGVSDGAGGVYIAWLDPRDGNNAYVQRLTATGSVAPGWPVNGFPVTTAGATGVPNIAPDGSSGLIVVLVRAGGVYAQRVTANAAIAPGFPADGKLVSNTLFSAMSACTDGAGGSYIVRNIPESPNPSWPKIVLTRITSEGVLASGWTESGNVVAASGQGFTFLGANFSLRLGEQGEAIAGWTERWDLQVDQVWSFLTRYRPNGVRVRDYRNYAPCSGGLAPGVSQLSSNSDGQRGILATWRDTAPPGFPYFGQTGTFGCRWDSTGAERWTVPSPVPYVLAPFPDGTGATYLTGKPDAASPYFVHRRPTERLRPGGRRPAFSSRRPWAPRSTQPSRFQKACSCAGPRRWMGPITICARP